MKKTVANITAMVRNMFGFNRHSSSDNPVDEAIERLRSAGNCADLLNQKLQPYVASKDPFSLFVSDMYNLGQSNRAYRGPPSD